MKRLGTWAAGPDVLAERFELVAPIGEGGMGTVWRARDRVDGADVAVKILVATDDEARFERETSALSTLRHPGIVRHVTHGTDGGRRFVVMELLEGVTLAERLRRGRLDVADALAIAHRIAEALAAAHAIGIVHRDLKPSNVFLVGGAADDARLLDFGLARQEGAPRITRTGALPGTPRYIAPELVRGAREVDPRVDVFALGCVLFECLAGRAAFEGADDEETFARTLLEAPPSLDALGCAAPDGVEALLRGLIEKDPARRPRDAAAVVRAIAALRSGAPPPPAKEPKPVGPGDLIDGAYRLDRILGEGGMGVVFEALHLPLDRLVAVKLLHPGGRTPRDEARLLREAQSASRLESEHVARVLDVGTCARAGPYVVLELLRGRDLGRVLREDGPLSAASASAYVLEACDAIAEAHARGIIHRDLKPSNLFLAARADGSRLVKVLDFGISKSIAPGVPGLTETSAPIGSAPYMSPEQLRGAKDVDARTDVWALGVTLHELCAGSPPFAAGSAAAVGARIAADAPDPLPKAAAVIAPIVRRCLEKDPGRRFASVSELATALRAPGGAAPRWWLLAVLAGSAIAIVAVAPRSRPAPAPAQPASIAVAAPELPEAAAPAIPVASASATAPRPVAPRRVAAPPASSRPGAPEAPPPARSAPPAVIDPLDPALRSR